MKYVKAIFENADVQELATSNEDLIDLAAESLISYNVAIESDIYANLEDYLAEDDIAATYESIRDTVLEENLSFIKVSSQIIGSDLPIEDKVLYFMEVQEAAKSPDRPSFVRRHKGKLIALGALAGAAGAGYAGHKGMLGASAKELVDKGISKASKAAEDVKAAGVRQYGKISSVRSKTADRAAAASKAAADFEKANIPGKIISGEIVKAGKDTGKGAVQMGKDLKSGASTIGPDLKSATSDLRSGTSKAIQRVNSWFAKRSQIAAAKEASKKITPEQLEALTVLRHKTEPATK